MSERGLVYGQQEKYGNILKAEAAGSIPRQTVEVTELEVPSVDHPILVIYIFLIVTYIDS